MEQSPATPKSPELQKLLPRLMAWAEEQQREIVEQGTPLTTSEISMAEVVGVVSPEQVRILEVEDAIPAPLDEALVTAANSVGFNWKKMAGLTIGYGIFIKKGYRSEQLMSHELRHVQQYEDFGSTEEFLREYLTQLSLYGYRDAPLEIDARYYEIKNKSI